MHDVLAERVVGQKASQMGFTEWSLNRTMFSMDILKEDVLYVLPNTRPDASDFSIGRFDAAIEESPQLSQMFSTTKNVGLKLLGTSALYIRGSNSRSGLKGLPVGLLVLDELDEMEDKQILLALQRLAGQEKRTELMLSTPSIPSHGINNYYVDSTQDHFFFPCHSCNRSIELTFPDNIVIIGEDAKDPRVEESHYICNHCKAVISPQQKKLQMQQGQWVSSFKQRNAIGFHVNHMYSTKLDAGYEAKAYLHSLTDPSAEQEFHNSNLGLPHVVADAMITDEMVSNCIGTFRKHQFFTNGLVTMGIDVGKKLHVEICLWRVNGQAGFDVNSYSTCQVLWQGTKDDFLELDMLMHSYHVNFAVIDENPDRRSGLQFANRWPGRVKLCRYPVGMNSRTVMVASDDEHLISVDRTSWLDQSLGRFRKGTISLPIDVSLDYRQQVTAQVRVPGKDKRGNPTTAYKTPGNKPDHFGHARNYAEIALPFALGLGVTQDIRN